MKRLKIKPPLEDFPFKNLFLEGFFFHKCTAFEEYYVFIVFTYAKTVSILLELGFFGLA